MNEPLAEWVKRPDLYVDVPWDKLANRCELFRIANEAMTKKLAEVYKDEKAIKDLEAAR